MVCTAFCSRTAPPLTHPPPFPAPGSTLDPSTSSLHPPSTCTQHPSPGLCLALFAHPLCLRHLLPRLHRPSFCAPPLHLWTPCMRPSPDTWPPLHGPPIACTPIPPVLPVCAQEG